MTESQPTVEAVVESRSLLDRIAEEGRIGQSAEERTNGKVWLKDLVQDVMAGQMTVSKDTELMINSRIADLDALISRQLNEVMHAEPLQKLEGAWRGLHYFVQQTETSSSLKIKLMNISKTDLFKDLDKAVEFDQSADLQEDLRRRVRHPWRQSVRCAGRRLTNSAAIRRTSRFSRKCPASPLHRTRHLSLPPRRRLFNFESFTELAGPRDLEKIFDNETYLKWNMFRKSDDSRYVGLCMPHVLDAPALRQGHHAGRGVRL